MTKFIVVSGGVVSGIGKGVIGMRLQPVVLTFEFETPSEQLRPPDFS